MKIKFLVFYSKQKTLRALRALVLVLYNKCLLRCMHSICIATRKVRRMIS